MIRAIWDAVRRPNGEFLWYALERGAPFNGNANTVTENGSTMGIANPIADWFKYFLLRDPSWDWHTLTASQFEELFDQSVAEYTEVIGTDNPDLRAFRSAGGKLLVWHGWSDHILVPRGTVDYYERVEDLIGAGRTRDSARLFMAPGVEHCNDYAAPQPGPGPAPLDPLTAVVRWVEQGEPPDRLEAAKFNPDGSVALTRPLCPYPKVAQHRRRGDTNDSRSFACQEVVR